jgi:hypothetical protein
MVVSVWLTHVGIVYHFNVTVIGFKARLWDYDK